MDSNKNYFLSNDDVSNITGKSITENIYTLIERTCFNCKKTFDSCSYTNNSYLDKLNDELTNTNQNQNSNPNNNNNNNIHKSASNKSFHSNSNSNSSNSNKSSLIDLDCGCKYCFICIKQKVENSTNGFIICNKYEKSNLLILIITNI